MAIAESMNTAELAALVDKRFEVFESRMMGLAAKTDENFSKLLGILV
jgi:hypothetical protein